MATCTHLELVEADLPRADQGCAQCLAAGDTWVHLRQCLSCGHVGCCDASRNKHATRHFQDTAHPVVRSAEKGEDWIWCYADKVFVLEH